MSLTMDFVSFNPVVGDIENNKNKILNGYNQSNADVVIYPECALTGYPIQDLIFNNDFQIKVEEAIEEIVNETNEKTIIFGSFTNNGKLFNSAIIASNQSYQVINKTELPNYGVFDEKRYFTSNTNGKKPIELKGHKVGIAICEDVWLSNVCRELTENGSDFIISINASPYSISKNENTKDIIQERFDETGTPLFYINQFGGNDELFFDGAFRFINHNQFKNFQFTNGHNVVKYDNEKIIIKSLGSDMNLTNNSEYYNALVYGLGQYVRHNGFSNVVIGISGGIDSAVVAKIAVDALGPDYVHGVMMPSKYSSQLSKDLAIELCDNLGIKLDSVPIDDMFSSFNNALQSMFSGKQEDVTEENLQARIRGTILMAISNKFGGLVLGTSNMSEICMGYGTLYGDMVGAFNPLKDLYKTDVYELAREIEEIPEGIITRPPSAELREDQKDSDSLPDYDVLDEVLTLLVEHEQNVQVTSGVTGMPLDQVKSVKRKINNSEFKRFQACPGIKIRDKGFCGGDRRYPLVNVFS